MERNPEVESKYSPSVETANQFIAPTLYLPRRTTPIVRPS